MSTRAESSQWSDREIARRCSVNHQTVAKVRRDLTGEIASERTVTTKHGTVTTMQTANIGSAGGAMIALVQGLPELRH